MTDPSHANAARFFVELGSYDQDDLKVVRFSSEEALGELFTVTVEFASRDPELDLEAITGAPAVFYVSTETGERYLHGIATEISRQRSTPRHTFYTVTIRPKPWVLTRRTDCRIFQDITTEDILKAVFDVHGLTSSDLEFDLASATKAHHYCVQYRETDFDFVTRLLQDEGLYFSFDSDAERSVMVVTDKATQRPALPVGDDSLRYAPPGGMMPEDDRPQVFDAELRRAVVHEAYATRGWNIEQPSEMHDARTARESDPLEVFESIDVYDDAEVGGGISGRRLEALQAREVELTGRSNAVGVVPGYALELGGDERPEFDGEYHVVAVTQTGASGQSLEEDMATGGESTYSNVFVAIPAATPYRPARTIPRPLAEGTQLGLVVGSSNAEIETDEYGRIKVRFRWHRESPEDETSSCWIPVAQPWAGSDFGFLAIPRVGQEVVVDFIDGNPDRPIVVGSVYNGENMSPQTLEENKSRMILRSRSLGGSGGFNEITLDDKESSEELFMHAERDMRQTVKRNRTRSVGGDESVTVSGKQTTTVKKDQELTVQENRTTTVVKEQTLTTGEDFTRNSGKNEIRDVAENVTLTVGGDVEETVRKSVTTTIGKDQTVTVGNARKTEVGGGDELAVTGELEVSSSGATKVDAGKTIELNAADEIKLTCGSASISLKKNGTIEIAGVAIKINGQGPIDMVSSANVNVKGAVVQMN